MENWKYKYWWNHAWIVQTNLTEKFREDWKKAYKNYEWNIWTFIKAKKYAELKLIYARLKYDNDFSKSIYKSSGRKHFKYATINRSNWYKGRRF